MVGFSTIGGIDRSSVIVVAASDTPDKLKARADYVCRGTNTTGGDEAVINAALQEGKTVLLLPGTYWLSGSVLPDSGQALIGSGWNTVLKLMNNYTATTTVYLIHVNAKNNVLIKDLVVDGNKANQSSGYYQVGIYLYNSTNCIIESCYVINTNDVGIYLYGSSNNKVVKNNLQYTSGIEVLASSYINTIAMNMTLSCTYGVYVKDSSHNVVVGNMYRGGSYGIFLYNAQKNAIIGNICINSSYYCIYLYSEANNNTIVGNVTIGAGFYNIHIKSSSYNIVAKNICLNSSSYNIYLYSAANHNTVAGNVVIGGTRCISLSTNVSYNTLTENTCRHNNTSSYGIYIENSSCTNNVIHGNDLYSSGLTADIYDAGTSTRKRDNIGNNGAWLVDA